MSKRSDEKERLARLLEAGQITQERYDERMARMTRRGAGSREKHLAEHREETPITPQSAPSCGEKQRSK